MVHSQTLYSGPLVSISDACCRSPVSSGIEDEHAASHQVVFTRSGVFVKHAGRRCVVAEPTHAIFFDKDETYRVSHPLPDGDDCTVFHCSEALARELAGGAWPTFGAISAGVLLTQHQLRRAIRLEEATAMEIEETALWILRAVVGTAQRQVDTGRTVARDSTAKSRRRLVNDTKMLLAAHPTESLSLVAVARLVASSPFHLSRVFREEVGMPIHQYLLRLRLALALERIAQGATALSPLALELGFSSHSHFTTLFKRTFGAPPSAFCQ
jgi:AraC family transcriptional regulator